MYLHDAFGRVRPKVGHTRRYHRRRRLLESDAHAYAQRRAAGIIVHHPERVTVNTYFSPGRKRPPGRLPSAHSLRGHRKIRL